MIRTSVLVAAVLAALPVVAQTAVTRPRVIVANGEATVAVLPDMARVNVGVITTDKSATDAVSKNAGQATAVIDALRQVLGPGADVRTVSYDVTTTYSQRGGQPLSTGFQVTNIVQATVLDVVQIGRVIDAAIRAGANRIDSIRFGLRDETPTRTLALRAAAQNARTRADAITAGLGVRTGAVVSAEEAIRVFMLPMVVDPASVKDVSRVLTTPSLLPPLDVSASVTLTLEIVP